MTGWTRSALLLLLGVVACRAPSPAPVAVQPRYVVGTGYEAGGAWFYPREEFRYDATGLATVAAAQQGLTANREAADPSAMAAAHPTLQLPAVARVTNLENGRQVLVRVNDRGPANPARLIALTPRAAELLGMGQGAARVRVQVETAESQALAQELGGGPQLQLAAAPRDTIGQEALAPPPGASASSRGRHTANTQAPLPGVVGVAAASVPLRLPETVLQVFATPGRLWVRAGEFGRAEYAERLRAQLTGLSAGVERVREGRSESYRVRAGPFATVGEADSALDQARRAGVTDARITVE